MQWVQPSQQLSSHTAAFPSPPLSEMGKGIGRAKVRKLMGRDKDSLLNEKNSKKPK